MQLGHLLLVVYGIEMFSSLSLCSLNVMLIPRDILYELAHVGELPLPQINPVSTNKRARNTDTPISGTGSQVVDAPSNTGLADTPRAFAGSQRVNITDPPNLTETQNPLDLLPSAQHDEYAMPIYTDELGRLPLHGQATQFSSTEDYWTIPAPGNHNQHVHPDMSNSRHQQQHHPEDEPLGQMSTMTPMDASFYNNLTDYTTSYPSTSMALSVLQYGNSASVAMHGYTPTTSERDYYPHPQEQQPVSQMPNSQMMIDEPMLAMWSSAPAGFEFVSLIFYFGVKPD